MTTPGSFDRLLAKLTSPTTKCAPKILMTKNESIFNPTTPPRCQADSLKRNSKNMVNSLEDWKSLSGYSYLDSPPAHDTASAAAAIATSPPAASVSTDAQLPQCTSPVPTPSPQEDDSSLEKNASRSSSSAKLTGCELALDIQEASPTSASPQVKVLFTMRSQPSAPTTPPRADPVDDESGNRASLALRSPDSPPPPPPMSDGSQPSRWSPQAAGEEEEGSLEEEGESYSPLQGELFSPLSDYLAESQGTEMGESLLCSEQSSPPPSPPPADTLRHGRSTPTETARAVSPCTPSSPSSDQLKQKHQVFRMQQQHKINSVSPVRAGVGMGHVVKMQRSTEWSSGEINAVFFAHNKHRNFSPGQGEGLAWEVDSPSSVLQSQWMRRHSPLDANSRTTQQRRQVRGDGMPPNKLNLRQVS
jgi:hypothetical protein